MSRRPHLKSYRLDTESREVQLVQRVRSSLQGTLMKSSHDAERGFIPVGNGVPYCPTLEPLIP
jgi:hypothetical protein